MTAATIKQVDIRNEQEVRDYFDRLEQDNPQLIEAMKVLGISYRQYILAMQAISQRTSISTGST